MRSHPLLVCALALAVAGCGGSGGGEGTAKPFTFRWLGVVDSIEDGDGLPVVLPNVQIGNTVTVTVSYDPAEFALGVVSGNGREYAAPEGLELTYRFSSGAVFVRTIVGMRMRDNGAQDLFSWTHDSGSLLFLAVDVSDTSLTLPFPIQLPFPHADLFSSQASFEVSGGGLRVPDPGGDGDVAIGFDANSFEIVAN